MPQISTRVKSNRQKARKPVWLGAGANWNWDMIGLDLIGTELRLRKGTKMGTATATVTGTGTGTGAEIGTELRLSFYCSSYC